MLSTSAGFQNLLKEGFRHYAGLEEAIIRNIEACKEISDKTKTSIGPNGMKKIVVNHIDKLFITSDAATMLKEIEVNHPAARMIVMAAKMQEQECGDMTNFIITFTGELLNQANDLIKLGLHPSDIVLGYEIATKKALELLKGLNHYEVTDPRQIDQVLPTIETALCPKMPGYYKHFAKIVADACIKILPEDNHFDLDHVRIVKIIGGGLTDSHLVGGMVVERPPFGTITSCENPKIACYNCPLEINGGETKGTVLIKNATDLLNFSKSEETLMERHIKSIADQGVNVLVVGGSISELASHYLEKYEIMAVRVMSKFDFMRIVKCLGAASIPQLGQPTQEELGYCKRIYVKEIGSEKVTVFEKDDVNVKLATIVVRGATKAILEDVARSISHGLNTFRVLLKNPIFINGAGATEAVGQAYLVHRQRARERSPQVWRPRAVLHREVRPVLRSHRQTPHRERRNEVQHRSPGPHRGEQRRHQSRRRRLGTFC